MTAGLDNSRILIVDDDQDNILLLSRTLREFHTDSALDGHSTLVLARQMPQPDLILLDIMMPGMDGFETCSCLKNDVLTQDIPIIFLSAIDDPGDKNKCFEMGAVDYITKPFKPLEVKARVRTHLKLKYANEALQNQNKILEQKVKERTREIYDTRLEIVYRLGRAAEYRDTETGMHIKRMSNYCACLARSIGLDESDIELLLHASPMHDVGKIGIPDRILLKNGKLDASEWEIMKTHTTIGAEILSGHESKLLETARIVALTHHERWDGSGYPRGLCRERIPLFGRIAGICDVFDALTSERPYKKSWPFDDAMSEIENGKGCHFDPELVSAFCACYKDISSIYREFSG